MFEITDFGHFTILQTISLMLTVSIVLSLVASKFMGEVIRDAMIINILMLLIIATHILIKYLTGLSRNISGFITSMIYILIALVYHYYQ
jgi:hypothetical protein